MENSDYKNKNIETKYFNTWHDCLINYIPEPRRKIVSDFRDKIVNLFSDKHTKTSMREERN